ncbi:hypothetical protein PVK06_024043 [Gossypium arboreum]|uniref:Uncharacterized protein n=1 Tax=Gossypium arboreum TaxID=29729 RepID=A0ABR0PD40_GOSAR|nr:hypothetical protein PVK06_024043 [Gossypium arboreum]
MAALWTLFPAGGEVSSQLESFAEGEENEHNGVFVLRHSGASRVYEIWCQMVVGAALQWVQAADGQKNRGDNIQELEDEEPDVGAEGYGR